MPSGRPRRQVTGVLLLDKPVGITSNHALQAVKRLYRAEKAGHAGTLDPLACGLLPVLFGDATKFSGYLLEAPKAYKAEIRLGITTTTADAEGEILERRSVNVSEAQIAAALQRFLGVQGQVPPMHSALKREGTPLYVLARRGESVERARRTIQIFGLDLLALSEDRATVQVQCSKGTYVRTLAEDIGKSLGCGAHLSALRRTATGPFRIAQAVTLDGLTMMTEAERDACLAPPDGILEQLPTVRLDPGQESRFRHGQAVAVSGLAEGTFRVYGAGDRFLGLATATEAGGLAPKRLLAEGNRDSPTG